MMLARLSVRRSIPRDQFISAEISRSEFRRTCLFPRKFLESRICTDMFISSRISRNSGKGQPSPRRTRSPSSPRRHVDGRTRGIRVPKPRLGWCRRGRSGLSIADASLRVHISPSAKTASFCSKDRFGRCCKAVVVQLRAPGFAGAFASFSKSILQRVTTGAPPSCLLHLHASRRTHGMYG